MSVDAISGRGDRHPRPTRGWRRPAPRAIDERRGRSDRIFHGGASLSGMLVLAIMVAVGLFLSIQAFQALKSQGLSFFTTSEWQPDRNSFGIAAVLLGTVLIALVAVSIALPISIGTALFITEVAPVWLRSTLVALVDLMAAVPSVVYGLWGLFLLQGQVIGRVALDQHVVRLVPVLRGQRRRPDQPVVERVGVHRVDVHRRDRRGDDGDAHPVRR